MPLSLKERMLQSSLRKEQKRAERESEVTLTSGPDICFKLADGRQITRHGLDRMRMAVRIFRDGGPKLDMALKQMSSKKRAMYRLVSSEFKGEWMEMFERLVDAIPDDRRDSVFSTSWDDWRRTGGAVGMNDQQVVDALRVMLVFRDR